MRDKDRCGMKRKKGEKVREREAWRKGKKVMIGREAK